MKSAAPSRRAWIVLVTSLVVALSVAGGVAGAAPAIQGVHGAGLVTRLGFTDQYAVNVTRQPSGALAGHIQARGGTWRVEASPTFLAFRGSAACITGVVDRGYYDLGTPHGIVLLVADVAGGPDLIASALSENSFDEPEGACFALSRALVLPPVPALSAGNFTFIGN
jgi:hypothetical protein